MFLLNYRTYVDSYPSEPIKTGQSNCWDMSLRKKVIEVRLRFRLRYASRSTTATHTTWERKLFYVTTCECCPVRFQGNSFQVLNKFQRQDGSRIEVWSQRRGLLSLRHTRRRSWKIQIADGSLLIVFFCFKFGILICIECLLRLLLLLLDY